ncbi:MAG TPA: 30S ribosomal protein S16 [Candidatus Margulisiibacteriota bacterium]|nr:30S ribosomal protein S16 [Candidatus Margulisiibacteriota bacterium]
MAATIRLSRHGAKKRPFYRIIVTDSRAPRDGRRLDQVGTYDPGQNPERVVFQQDKLEHWLRRGARPSLTVSQLMKRSGIARAAGITVAGASPGEAQT